MRSTGILFVLGLIAGLGLVACSDDGENKTDGGVKGEIQFGLIAPVSGTLEQYGKGSKNGAELAAKEINANGGLLGATLKIITKDEESGTDAVAKAFVDDDNIVGIVGPIKSSSSFKAIPVIQGKIVAISTAATAPSLTDATDGDSFFRAVPSDAYQGQAAAAYVYKELKLTKAAMIHNDGAYGAGLAAEFEKAFKALGGQILADVSYKEQDDYDTFDFAPMAKEVFAGKPEVVFMVGYHQDGAKFVAAAKNDAGYKDVAATVKWMGCDAHDSEFKTLADDTVIAGKFFGTYPGPNKAGPEYKAYAEAFRKEYGLPAGENPVSFSDSSYDAVYLMAAAFQKLGSATKDDRMKITTPLRDVSKAPGDKVIPGEWAKVVAALKDSKDIDYDGAAGPQDFDANGDPEAATFAIYKLTGGGKVEYIVDNYEGWK